MKTLSQSVTRSLCLALCAMLPLIAWARTDLPKTGDNVWKTPMPAYDIELHVEYWGEFAISYDLAGGINNPANPAIYYEDEALTLLPPTREDYTFAGWTGSNGEEPETEVIIPAGSTGEKSYIAHWAEEDPSTGWKDVSSDVHATKVMENGVLYLIYGGTKYNVQGCRVY